MKIKELRRSDGLPACLAGGDLQIPVTPLIVSSGMSVQSDASFAQIQPSIFAAHMRTTSSGLSR